MAAQSSIIANAYDRTRDVLRRWFPQGFSAKHDYAKDYGWKEQLCFSDFHRMYTRSSIAASGVDKTIAKTWQTMPALWESEDPSNSTAETAIATHFAKKNLWRSLMDADRRSMVGCYGGAILILRDGLRLDQPVTRVTGGIESLVKIVPAWEGQLTVAEWDNVETSETYGEPLFFQFNEQAVGDAKNTGMSQVRIHRDRMLIWSDDGTLNCHSALEPGYDDVSDAMKIKGAGGEGFWKSARGAPIIEAPQGVTAEDLRRGMGAATTEDVVEKLNDKVDAFQAGFDKAFMVGGFSVKPMTITLPQPKEFWEPCVQSFAASLSIPMSILLGNTMSERSSTEDASEWAETNMSRRQNRVVPILSEFVERLVRWGMLDAKPWAIGWDSLTDASPSEKMDLATKMATINMNLKDEPAFLPDEIREAAGYAPSDEVEGFDEFMAERAERQKQAAEDGPTETIPAEDQP